MINFDYKSHLHHEKFKSEEEYDDRDTGYSYVMLSIKEYLCYGGDPQEFRMEVPEFYAHRYMKENRVISMQEIATGKVYVFADIPLVKDFGHDFNGQASSKEQMMLYTTALKLITTENQKEKK
jgi:hypothetical protein